MKKYFYIFISCYALVILASCSSNTYANLLKEEKALVADYIKRENINVIYEVPQDNTWGEKDYLNLSGYGYDDMYFHLVSEGDTTTAAIKKGDMVVLRYRRYTLDVNADTLSFWTTSDGGYPIEFLYLTDYTTACTGWHAATTFMKYSGAECKIINPSKLGFGGTGQEQSTVTPYGYDMKIKIRR